MSRNLRLAHLPPMHARLRFSGYVTDPSITPDKVAFALRTFLANPQVWSSRANLPLDWPAADDSMIQDPPPGRTPIWWEGDDVTAAPTIGDAETPWRLVIGQGQLVTENVWLYDANADPWPVTLTSCPPCPPTPTCPPCSSPSAPAPSLPPSPIRPCPACPSPFNETVTPPSQCNSFPTGVFGALLGGAAAAAGTWWLRR
jgi:hypothetical protein